MIIEVYKSIKPQFTKDLDQFPFFKGNHSNILV